MKIIKGIVESRNLNPMLLLGETQFKEWYEESVRRFSECEKSMTAINSIFKEGYVRFAGWHGRRDKLSLLGFRGVELDVYALLGINRRDPQADSKNKLVIYRAPKDKLLGYLPEVEQVRRADYDSLIELIGRQPTDNYLTLKDSEIQDATSELIKFYEEIHQGLIRRSAEVYISLIGNLHI